MRIDILTIFPRLFDSYLGETIVKRAQQKRKVTIRVHDIRAAATDRHRTVDDRPYGGGPGMILMAEPVVATLTKVLRASAKTPKRRRRIILLSPQGATLTQRKARAHSAYDQLILICGRYEGFDARTEHYIDEQLSIGDYVLSGGEVAAMVVMDAVIRLIPGVLSNPDSTAEESFSAVDFVEYPQYTRPELWRGRRVPPVLLSGDHRRIAAWRMRRARKRPRR